MLRRVVFACVVLAVCIHYAGTGEAGNAVDEGRIRAASESAVKLIQRSQAVWYQKQGCASCHHQLIPEFTLKLARERGITFDAAFARRHSSTAFAGLKDLDECVQGAYFIDVYFDAITLVAASEAGIKPSLPIIASALFVARRQYTDGSWHTMDDRPPQAHSTFAATAYGARAIKEYLPNELAAERDRRIERARQWLLNNAPKNNEDRVFRLLGLAWTGAPESAGKEAEKALLAEQRDDGGWSQLPYLTSDAYATGEALVALSESRGFATSNPAWQRGIAFLLNTQKPDGSWHVKSRLNPPAPVSPQYFESQFPYGHDQFVSVMGSSWAAAALMKSLPAKADTASRQTWQLDETGKEEAWIRTVLTGGSAELTKALDGGLNPNSKTAAGTTALMLAAGDPEKLKILLDRGANINDRAESGFTALMVASRYFGNGKAVKLLLLRNAKPVSPAGVSVRNDMTALFLGTTSGDVEIVEALTNARAAISVPAKLLGTFYASPIQYATFGGDEPMVALLLKKGADPNAADSEGLSLLTTAAIGNHTGVVKRLLQAGARVNQVDTLGMTPLLYAASIDYGDSEVMNTLIAAGADMNQKDKQGRTALELAQGYKHASLIKVLNLDQKSR